MNLEFEVSGIIKASPEQIYNAWLSSEGHTGMTGSKAEVSNIIGDVFQAWDGYIQGRNIELEPNVRILQSWRTTEFKDTDEDSRLEILLDATKGGSLVTIFHSLLPDHGMKYKQGWVDAYFLPMEEYFQRFNV